MIGQRVWTMIGAQWYAGVIVEERPDNGRTSVLLDGRTGAVWFDNRALWAQLEESR